MQKFKFINSNILKVFAMICMVLDHMWATIIPGNQWMNNVGRLAFPIFAFLIVEGFIHTSDFKKYIKRLFIFAVISEIPFNLMSSSSIIFPFHQNTIFTLLLGLLCISEIDKIKTKKDLKTIILGTLKIILFLLLGVFGLVDYGLTGILTIIVFYVFRNIKLSWLWQLISLVCLYIVFFGGRSIIVNILGTDCFIPIQGLAVLSLIPIWLYNGKRGKNNKLLQYTYYLFYPVHMLCLYLIYYFIL